MGINNALCEGVVQAAKKRKQKKTKYAENTRIFKMKQNAQSNTGLILIFGFLMSKVGVVRKR